MRDFRQDVRPEVVSYCKLVLKISELDINPLSLWFDICINYYLGDNVFIKLSAFVF